MPTQTEKATEKINAIYDKLSIAESIEVYNENGKYLHQRISDEQKKKAKEIEDLANLKNQVSGTSVN